MKRFGIHTGPASVSYDVPMMRGRRGLAIAATWLHQALARAGRAGLRGLKLVPVGVLALFVYGGALGLIGGLAFATCAWDAWAIQQVWRWHFAQFAEPWPLGRLYVAMVALRHVLAPDLSKLQKRQDKKTGKELAEDLAKAAIGPAVMLLIAWWLR